MIKNINNHKIVFLALLLNLVFACEEQEVKENPSALIEEILLANEKLRPDTKACTCDSILPLPFERMPNYCDLTFSNTRKSFEVDTLFQWLNEDRLKIKSLKLSDFDTIPEMMGIFSNVETIKVIGYKDIEGLNNFPKLKYIEFHEARIIIDSSDSWMSGIRYLSANKTRIDGLETFKRMPQLQKVNLGYSGFDKFPKNFSSLKCLESFQTGAHLFGAIDLSEIDLMQMPCLKEIYFTTWYDKLEGLPKGLSKRQNISVKINHQKLTKAETKLLNDRKR